MLSADMQNVLDKDRLAQALSRCAFLLHKISNGDHKALENAPDAVNEAVEILRDIGEEEEWMGDLE